MTSQSAKDNDVTKHGWPIFKKMPDAEWARKVQDQCPAVILHMLATEPDGFSTSTSNVDPRQGLSSEASTLFKDMEDQIRKLEKQLRGSSSSGSSSRSTSPDPKVAHPVGTSPRKIPVGSPFHIQVGGESKPFSYKGVEESKENAALRLEYWPKFTWCIKGGDWTMHVKRVRHLDFHAVWTNVHSQYATLSRSNKTKQENAWRDSLFDASKCTLQTFTLQYYEVVAHLRAVGVEITESKEREIYLYAMRDNTMMQLYVSQLETRDQLAGTETPLASIYVEAGVWAVEHAKPGVRQPPTPSGLYADPFSPRPARPKVTDEELSSQVCLRFLKGICKDGAKCKRQHTTAPGAKSPAGSTQPPQEWVKTAHCFYCGKTGHLKCNCKSFLADKASGNMKEDKVKRPAPEEGKGRRGRGRGGKKSDRAEGQPSSFYSTYFEDDDHYPQSRALMLSGEAGDPTEDGHSFSEIDYSIAGNKKFDRVGGHSSVFNATSFEDDDYYLPSRAPSVPAKIDHVSSSEVTKDSAPPAFYDVGMDEKSFPVTALMMEPEQPQLARQRAETLLKGMPPASHVAQYIRQRLSFVGDTGCTGHFLKNGVPAIQGTATACDRGVFGISAKTSVKSTVRADAHFVPDFGKPMRLNSGLGVVGSRENLLSIPILDRDEGQCGVFGNGRALILADSKIMDLIPADSIVASGILGADMHYRFEGYATDAPFEETFDPTSPGFLTCLSVREFSALQRTYLGKETRSTILHQRFRHCGKQYLFNVFGCKDDGNPCTACLDMTATRLTQPQVGRRQPTKPNQFTQTDSMGPFKTKGPRGERYVQNWVCGFDDYAYTDCPKLKSEFKQLFLNQTARSDREGHPMEVLGLDTGSEGRAHQIAAHAKLLGLKLEFAPPGGHESIGRVENYGHRQIRCCKTWLHAAGAPPTFLFHAARHFTLVGRLMPRSNEPGSSPMERRQGFTDPHITASIRIPFTLCWVTLNPDVDQGGKLGVQGEPAILMCLSDEVKDGYEVLRIRSRRMSHEAHVRSIENVFPFKNKAVWESLGLALGIPMGVQEATEEDDDEALLPLAPVDAILLPTPDFDPSRSEQLPPAELTEPTPSPVESMTPQVDRSPKSTQSALPPPTPPSQPTFEEAAPVVLPEKFQPAPAEGPRRSTRERVQTDHGPYVSHISLKVTASGGVQVKEKRASPVPVAFTSYFESQRKPSKKKKKQRKQKPSKQKLPYDLNKPPASGPEAIARPDFLPRWKKTMLDEVKNLEDHGTWDPWRKRLPTDHVLGSIWAGFKTKVIEAVPATAGAPAVKAGERDKARLVMLGNNQRKDEEYSTCSSPTCKSESIRSIFVKAAHIPEAVMCKGDVTAAYLCGHVRHKITCGMIYGLTWEEIGAPSPYHVRDMIGNQYGLKQAQDLWREVYHPCYLAAGFKVNPADICMYHFVTDTTVKTSTEETWTMFIDVAVHVDDSLNLYLGQPLWDTKFRELQRTIEIRVTGIFNMTPLKFMGENVRRDVKNNAIYVDCSHKIEEYLEILEMPECRPSLTPYTAGFKASDYLAKDETEKEEMYHLVNQCVGLAQWIGRTAIELLGWLHFVHLVCHNPSRDVRKLLIRGGRYLKSVQLMPMIFRADPKIPLSHVRYSSDASLEDLPRSRTTGGSCCFLAGNCIWAHCGKQGITTMGIEGFHDDPADIADESKGVVMRATSGAEIVQLDMSVHHARHTHASCGDRGLNLGITLPIEFDEDNQTSLDLCDPNKQWRSRNFIGIRAEIIRYEVAAGFAKLFKKGTADIEADIWTKMLPSIPFIKIRDKLRHTAFAIQIGAFIPIPVSRYFDDDQRAGLQEHRCYYCDSDPEIDEGSDPEIDAALHQREGKCSSNPDSDGPPGGGSDLDPLTEAMALMSMAEDYQRRAQTLLQSITPPAVVAPIGHSSDPIDREPTQLRTDAPESKAEPANAYRVPAEPRSGPIAQERVWYSSRSSAKVYHSPMCRSVVTGRLKPWWLRISLDEAELKGFTKCSSSCCRRWP